MSLATSKTLDKATALLPALLNERLPELGIDFIDTAEAYRRSEELIGQALAEWSGSRDQLFVATKVRGDDLSADHIVAAVEHSLQVLRIETIDLLQAHSWDEHHRIEETMTALDTAFDAERRCQHTFEIGFDRRAAHVFIDASACTVRCGDDADHVCPSMCHRCMIVRRDCNAIAVDDNGSDMKIISFLF